MSLTRMRDWNYEATTKCTTSEVEAWIWLYVRAQFAHTATKAGECYMYNIVVPYVPYFLKTSPHLEIPPRFNQLIPINKIWPHSKGTAAS